MTRGGQKHASDDDDLPSPGYLWRPGSSPRDNPLHITVAVVIGLVVVFAVAAAILA